MVFSHLARLSGKLARSGRRTVAFVKVVTPLAQVLHVICISSLAFDNGADAVLNIAPKAKTRKRPRGILKAPCARLSTCKWRASVTTKLFWVVYCVDHRIWYDEVLVCLL